MVLNQALVEHLQAKVATNEYYDEVRTKNYTTLHYTTLHYTILYYTTLYYNSTVLNLI